MVKPIRRVLNEHGHMVPMTAVSPTLSTKLKEMIPEENQKSQEKPTVSLVDLTVKELRALCKEKEITLPKKVTKAGIITALEVQEDIEL